MTRGLPTLLLAVCAATALAPHALGQLQVSVTANGTTTANVPAGGSLSLVATGIGQPVYAAINVTNSGAASVTITGISISGTTEIGISSSPVLPVTLSPNGTASFSAEYLPASGNAVTGQVSIAYAVGTQSSNFLFTLTGTSPRLTFTYAFPPSSTLTALTAGNTISFPATNTGSSVAATVNVLNAGSATGNLNSVSLTGTGFQLSSSPAPIALTAGQQVSVGILFAPQAAVTDQGSLTLVFSSGNVTFPLLGTGTSPSFSATYSLANGNAFPLTTGTAITFPSVDINGTSTAAITISNQGTGSGTVTSVSVGGAAFQLSGLPALPATVAAGQSLHFNVLFAPTQSGTFSGTLLINLSGGSISSTLAASTSPSNITLAYTDPTTGSTIPLANNSTLPFPNTTVGSVTNVTLFAINSGTGTGLVNSIALGGANAAAFQLLNLPVLPASVGPSQQSTFGVRFTPTQSQTYTATLVVTVNGQPVTINLTGQATSVQFTYSATAATGTTSFSPGGTVAVAGTVVGQTTSETITVTNTGGASGQIAAISVTGQGLTVSNLPAFPLTLAAGASQQFILSFTPTQAGAITGQLVIGSATFTVTATGTASQYTYSATGSSGTASFVPGGTVAIASTVVGQTTNVTISVTNNGNASGQIAAISVTGQGLALSNLPAFPLTLAAGASQQFTLGFTPTQAGAITGQLFIGSASFTVTATGTASQPSFSATYTLANGNTYPLSAGATISFPAVDINVTSTATITVSNQGGSGSVTAISVTGSAFQLSGLPALPATVPANQTLRFGIVFAPTQSGTFSGTFAISWTGGSVSGTLTASTAPSNITLAYTDPTTNSTIPLSNNSTVPFPNTTVGSVANITLLAINSGTGTGFVNSIVLGGANASAFQLMNLPVLPASVPPSQQASFGLRFSPTLTQNYSATLAVTVNGQAITLNLVGAGTGAQFTYLATASTGATSFVAGGTVAVPSTVVGQTTSVTISVTNTGNANGQIAAINVTGQGLTVTNLPALPLTLASGASQQFILNFAPTQASTVTGQLTIGTATFVVTATGTASQPSFSATYALANGNVIPLSSGVTITFPPVDINVTSTATITVSNQGGGSGTVNSISTTGAAFQLTGLPAFPATVAANQTLRFGIVFAPTQSGTYSGTFSISWTGGAVSGNLSASTAPSSISLSYIDPATNNVLPLANNSTLPFPNTLIGSVANISLLAPNTGTGTGFINSISLGGANASVFQLLNLPPFPVSVAPNQQATFGVRFTPQLLQTYSATLTVTVNGQPLTVNLSAQGTGPQYTYSVTAASGTTTVASGGTVAIAGTSVGQTTSVTVSVTNNGTGNGQIPGISVTGQGLALSNLPPFPLTLASAASQQFTLSFTPTQPGPATGQLTIGTATFTVTSTGIGSQLVYSYANSAGSTTVVAGGTVIFAPLAVGSTENVVFTVQNTGTSAASISSINLAAASSVFTLQQLPGLPLSLAPNAAVTFTASFAPNNTGTVAVTLAVDTVAFTLSGTGSPPPSLPAYQFQGPSGTLAAAQQPALGLTLASPYALAIQGSLTLTFTSDVFTDDPSIQFASGGRTVNFTIPANSTQAVFQGGNSTIALQSGTTAGTILITPSFATQGGYNLTPSSPNTLTLTVPHSVPQLTSATITSVTSTSFTLVLNGYTTTRVLNSLTVQFTPVAGTSLSTSSVPISLGAAATAWFESATAAGFGGSFVVAVPFTLQGGGSTANPVGLLQSLSVTATNDVGTSPAVSVPVP